MKLINYLFVSQNKFFKYISIFDMKFHKNININFLIFIKINFRKNINILYEKY